MSKQRKIAFLILVSMIISAFSFVNISALQIGDEIGNVLNTDIKTFINGQRIPSYNINNKSAVLIKDLINYGFDSVYNDQARTSSVTFNPNKKVTPLTNFDETSGPVGTVAFRYVYTDIVAFVNGKRVESFNIKGNVAIFFGDLGDYGTFAWDNAKRESRFTTSKVVTGITLDRSALTIKVNDPAFRLVATVSPADATNRTVIWTSSNTNVARVSDGNVTAISPGTTTITATSSNGLKATCTVTVQSAAVVVTRITLDKTTATVRVNEWLQLNATIAPANATDTDLTWTSSHPNIAKVHEGYIMGVAAGTATITVRSSNGIEARCTVTVQSTTVAVTEIKLDRSATTIKAGDSFILTATISPRNATDQTLTWTSSNESIARVSNGTVTGISAGTATITVRSSNRIEAKCTVTVQSTTVAVTGIKLDKTALVMKENELFQLNAEILPANATDKTVKWSSSNESVVHVYGNGSLIAISPGNAVITVVASNGMTATCTVTVQLATTELSDKYKTMMRQLAWKFVSDNAPDAKFYDLNAGEGIIIYKNQIVYLNYIFHPTFVKEYTQQDYDYLFAQLNLISPIPLIQPR